MISVKMIKDASGLRKNQIYSFEDAIAKVLIHRKVAVLNTSANKKTLPPIPAPAELKQMDVPENRVMTPKRRGRPPKKKNEYETKVLHAKDSE